MSYFVTGRNKATMWGGLMLAEGGVTVPVVGKTTDNDF
jgi:hypothetical protein